MDTDYFKIIKDKIKSSYCCNKEQCPKIKDRLDCHIKDHHSTTQHSNTDHIEAQGVDGKDNMISSDPTLELTQDDQCNAILVPLYFDGRNQGTTISSFESSRESKTEGFQKTYVSFTNSVQSEFISADLITTSLFTPNEEKSKVDNNVNSTQTSLCEVPIPIYKELEKYTESPDFQDYFNDNPKPHVSCESQKTIKLERKETVEILTPKNVFYKEQITEEVHKWLKDLPMSSNTLDKNNLHQEDKINVLIDAIYNMYGDSGKESYERKLKLEIDKYIDELAMINADIKLNDASQIKLKTNLCERVNSINERITRQVQSHDGNIEMYMEEPLEPDRKNIIANLINDWLTNIELNKNSVINIIRQENTVDLFLNRLYKLLDAFSYSKKYKLTLKGVIVELLLELPINFKYPIHKMVHINKLAEELTNRLLCLMGKFKISKNNTNDKSQRAIVIQTAYNENKEYFKQNNDQLKIAFIEVVNNILTSNYIQINKDIQEKILEVIIKNIDIIESDNSNNIENILYTIIYNYTDMPELQVAEIAKNILMEVKDVEKYISKEPSNLFIQPRLSGVLSIYNTEKKVKMLTSTPKKPKKKKISDSGIPKLNDEEASYLKELYEIVREWMETLPVKYDSPEDAELKSIMINELAFSLMDSAKMEQLSHAVQKIDKEFGIRDIKPIIRDKIYLWLHRYGIFSNLKKCGNEVRDLFSRVVKIPVPYLATPQHGTRQAISRAAWLAGADYYDNAEYIPKGIDILQDNISLWMDEQSDVFIDHDRSIKGIMVEDIAQDLQERLVGKHTDQEIINDIRKWLKDVVKADKKDEIPDLIEDLKNRIKMIPQDVTLDKRYLDRFHGPEYEKEKTRDSLTFDEDFLDPNGTMKGYIEKFIQKNYDVDDSLARKVFRYILKKELLRLNPAERQNVYDNSGQIGGKQIFSIDKFGHELEYVKMLSDWLNTLPVDPEFKVLKNKTRIELIHNLAKEISEIEAERIKFPNVMDYDAYIMSVISINILHLHLDKKQRVPLMQSAYSLLKKLEDYRIIAATKYPSIHPPINTDDLGEVVDELMQKHGKDVKDDPLKYEVWLAYLTEVVQHVTQESAEPTKLDQTQPEEQVPMNESIPLFSLELEYAKEICDWLQNLPIKSAFDPAEAEVILGLIDELTQKMIERRTKKLDKPDDLQPDNDITEYIKLWLKKLPLESGECQIDVPVVIQQILNRIDRANKSEGLKVTNDLPPITEESNLKMEKSIKTRSPSKSKLQQKDPENALIEAIEKFSNALPIQANNENELKDIKDDITRTLMQKICELNIDPVIYNDELLFKQIFEDDLDMILETMPQDAKFEKNKEKVKNTLIDTVVELLNAIKQQSAGENYKQKLENTIEASIPNPVQTNQVYDPGFEIYKDRLATKFILENFDQAHEEVKLKYEKLIQAEVDKYFEHALNRNAEPLTKDQIENELYSALFKVPISDEIYIFGQVEEAKTRFEIDAWYELLPVLQTDDLIELLERDKILSNLAKRIHEIEKDGKNVDTKIHNEIVKWLPKLKLMPGNDKNIDELANQLQSRLKSTAKERKSDSKGHSDKGKSKGKGKCANNCAEKRQSIHTVNNLSNQQLSTSKVHVDNHTMTMSPKVAADVTGAEERRKQQYKEQLRDTVCSLLDEPQKYNKDKTITLNKDVEKIIDDFVEYDSVKDNVEERNIPKVKIHNTVVQHLSKTKDKGHKESVDPQITRNQLICEMSRVPQPDEKTLQVMVEEIKMKNEVNDFFLELSFPKEDETKMRLRDEVRSELANKLYNLERQGHNNEIDNNMRTEILKCLDKLGKKVSPEVVDRFVQKLRNTETNRKFHTHRITSFQNSSAPLNDTYTIEQFENVLGQNTYIIPAGMAKSRLRGHSTQYESLDPGRQQSVLSQQIASTTPVREVMTSPRAVTAQPPTPRRMSLGLRAPSTISPSGPPSCGTIPTSAGVPSGLSVPSTVCPTAETPRGQIPSQTATANPNDKSCKCGSKPRKRRRVCMRDMDMYDDCCYPPFMWMIPPGYPFY